MECQHLCFKQEDQSVRMNEQRTNDGVGRVLRSELFVLTEISFIFFMKYKGCILNGIGARSIPVSRLAGRQADKTLIVFKNFKIL